MHTTINKIIPLFAMLLSGAGLSQISAQETAWHVDTDITKKNILMEDFTGTGCYWCPDGHAVAERMAHVWPGRIFPVNIHTGHLAQSYTTSAGDLIGQYMECEEAGFPSGAVNRRDFGDGLLMSRSLWQQAADYIMAEDAPVNLLLKSRYDADSRELSVEVEGFFTADVSTDQRLCVMLLQDNVWGYQNGPEPGDYRHMHMLRGTLTDTWGDAIDGASRGQFFKHDYTMTLPNRIGDVNVVPTDMQVVAFVSDGRTDVEQVAGVKPDCSSMDVPLSVALERPRIEISTHYGYHFFEVLLENECNQPITSASFDVTVGQQTSTMTIACDIDAYGFQYLSLPVDYTYSQRGTTKYSIRLTAVNDSDIEPQTLSGQFVKPYAATQQVTVSLQTDDMAAQTTFAIRDQQGDTVHEFGPFADGEALLTSETLTLAPGRTYCLEAADAWGNGALIGTTGYIELRDAQGLLIDKQNIYGYGGRIFFTTDETNGICMPTTSDAPAIRYSIDGRHAPAGQHGLVIEQKNGVIKKHIE